MDAVWFPTREPPPSRAEGPHEWRCARLLPDRHSWQGLHQGFPFQGLPESPQGHLSSTLLGPPLTQSQVHTPTPISEPPVNLPHAGRILHFVPASHRRLKVLAKGLRE